MLQKFFVESLFSDSYKNVNDRSSTRESDLARSVVIRRMSNWPLSLRGSSNYHADFLCWAFLSGLNTYYWA